MVDTMCNLSIGIARESAYEGYNKGFNVGVVHGEKIGEERGEKRGEKRGERLGAEKEAQRFGKLIQIFVKEGSMEKIQEVTDDISLRKSLYKKYHIE